MTIIKFTADVEGNNPDELEALARAAANDFFRDLPDVPVFKEASVSFDPDYYRGRIELALKEAEERVKAYRDAHGEEEGFEDLEAVPANVPKYSGWFEFEYTVKQTPPSPKTINEVWDERDAARKDAEEPYSGPPENDPKYQDQF